MVLNRNPDNFFNENEQVAFCPALVVPGELPPAVAPPPCAHADAVGQPYPPHQLLLPRAAVLIASPAH
jgi:hypothetical protein